MNRTRRLSNYNQSWCSPRKKEIDRFLTPRWPQQSTGLSRYKNAINAFFSELNAQALLNTTPASAHLDINLNAIPQMEDITAEPITPLSVDMPDYAGYLYTYL